jgi:hypothetical protein
MPVPYEAAIHVTMTGTAMSGMQGLIGKINEADRATKNLVRSLELLGAGAMLEKVAKKLEGAFKTVLDAAGNFQQVQDQLVAMGDTQKEVAEATATAWKLAGTHIHLSAIELIEMNRHANEIFGSAGNAAKHMSMMADIAEWQKRWEAGKTGVRHLDPVTATRDVMKAAEQGMVGWDPNTPGAMEEYVKKLVIGLIATGSNVTSSMYLRGQQGAKGAYASWEDSFKFGVFPAMLQEWSGAGVGAATSYAKLGAGARWSKQGILTGQELGIIDKSVDAGHPFTMRAQNIAGNELYQRDPLAWTEKYLAPALDKKFGPGHFGEKQAEIQRLLGDRNAVRFNELMVQQSQKLEKDRTLRDKAKMDMPGSWEQSLVAFEEKWKDLMTALGTPALGTATEALDKITKGIVSFTEWVNKDDNARLVRDLAGIGAGIAAFSVVIGAVAIGAGIVGLMPGGVIIVGIALLTGALAGLAAVDWEGVKKFSKGDFDKAIADKFDEIIAAVKAALASFFTHFKDLIVEGLSNVWQSLKDSIGSLFQHASFGGGGGGFGGGGALSAGERAEFATQIKARGGDDAASLLKIYGTEGASGYVGDGGTSFGPFQLHRGGPGSAGYIFEQTTGLNLADRSTVGAQIDFVRKWGHKHGGWSSDVWHGLRPHGGSIPLRTHPGGDDSETHVHVHIDGERVAHAVAKHASKMAQFPTQGPYFDSSRAFTSPDHGLATV